MHAIKQTVTNRFYLLEKKKLSHTAATVLNERKKRVRWRMVFGILDLVFFFLLVAANVIGHDK